MSNYEIIEEMVNFVENKMNSGMTLVSALFLLEKFYGTKFPEEVKEIKSVYTKESKNLDGYKEELTKEPEPKKNSLSFSDFEKLLDKQLDKVKSSNLSFTDILNKFEEYVNTWLPEKKEPCKCKTEKQPEEKSPKRCQYHKDFIYQPCSSFEEFNKLFDEYFKNFEKAYKTGEKQTPFKKGYSYSTPDSLMKFFFSIK